MIKNPSNIDTARPGKREFSLLPIYLPKSGQKILTCGTEHYLNGQRDREREDPVVH